jgi:hypothetical protein
MDSRNDDVLTSIRSTGKLEPETETALQAALNDLLKEFTAP